MYAIFTLDGLDQIVETRELARRECTEVAAICGEARGYRIPTGLDIEAWADANPGKFPTRKIGARLEIVKLAD